VRILVDVSNDRLSGELVDALERAGHAVERGVATPASVFDLALVGTADAAARLRRAQPTAAIIVVTRLDDVPERVRALEAGADDAFDRGFSGSQMVARVAAVGRRAAMTPRAPERYDMDGCAIDLAAATATRAPAPPVALTAREVEIVRWLARHEGHVVSRADLLQHVWRVAASTETRAVDVAIATLRAKLERDPASPTIIVSVRGVGYGWGILTNG
jgi:DNA-binding response OmpR family regulator